MKTTPTDTLKIESVHPGMHVVEGDNVAEIVCIKPADGGWYLDLHNADGTLTEGKFYPKKSTVQVLS